MAKKKDLKIRKVVKGEYIAAEERLDSLLPKVGDIIIFNEHCQMRCGISQSQIERRGCAIVKDISHPLFIIAEVLLSSSFSRQMVMYKADIYNGSMELKKVETKYYCGERCGLTWQELDVANF